MPFPFVAPFDPWVQEVLKHREQNPTLAMCKNPYAVLVSPAKVIQRVGAKEVKIDERLKEFQKFIKGEKIYEGKEQYDGCIIANNVHSLDLSYRTKNTALGIDFNGKVIEVIGETDRRVSTPIIQSIEVDTDGANNTTKNATVNVKCFTLKQLELFEMFFLRTGMNLLVEYGDASLMSGLLQKIEKSTNSDKNMNVDRGGNLKEIKPYERIEQALIQKTNYRQFIREFNDYYRSSLSGSIEYFKKTENSYGTYDFVAGLLTNYTYSIAEDLTYDVQLTISQGNQISIAVPNNPKNKNSNTKAPSAKDLIYTEEEVIKKIVYDFDLEEQVFNELINSEKENHPRATKDNKEANPFIKYDTFNFVKKNENDTDKQTSIIPYVSLRFILKILLNYSVQTTGTDKKIFELPLPKYKTKNGKESEKEMEMIPVFSHKDMISSNDMVIFPSGELPTFVVDEKNSQNHTKVSEKRTDGTINGYNFHLPPSTKVYIDNPKTCNVTDSNRIGNALNIFVNYYEVLRSWKQEIYRIDFLEKILNTINKESHGLFLLIYASPIENGKASVIDYKFSPKHEDLKSQEKQYRFKLSPNQSIVKGLTFNLEMSNLVAGMTVMNNNISMRKLNEKEDAKMTDEELNQPPSDDVYTPADRIVFANADEWYSFNPIELENLKERDTKKKDREKKKREEAKTNPNATTLETQTLDQEEEEGKKEEENLQDVIEQRYVKFKKADGSQISLIYKDKPYVDYIIHSLKDENNKDDKGSVLTYIDITVTVDGFSGFRAGQTFQIDGVPETYNMYGYFQITNIKHSINESGWTTTIEAGWRNAT